MFKKFDISTYNAAEIGKRNRELLSQANGNKTIEIKYLSRKEGIKQLADRVVSINLDRDYIERAESDEPIRIAYLVTGSRQEIHEELYNNNKDIKSIRCIYQPDEWDLLENRILHQQITEFYYDELYAVEDYFASNPKKTVLENIIDSINKYGKKDTEYHIYFLRKPKEYEGGYYD